MHFDKLIFIYKKNTFLLREAVDAIRGSHVTTIGRFCGAKFDGGFVSDPVTGRQTQANIFFLLQIFTLLQIIKYHRI